MTRIIRKLGSITLLLSAFGCANEATSPTAADWITTPVQVSLQPTQVVLATGVGMQLRVVMSGVEATPLGFPAIDMQWASSDESIVTVSPSGFIQARRIGTATVSATVTAPCGTHLAEVGVRVIPAGAIEADPPGAGER